jgi:hypothetical protein
VSKLRGHDHIPASCRRRRIHASMGEAIDHSQTVIKILSPYVSVEFRVDFCDRCHGWHLTPVLPGANDDTKKTD